MSVWRCLSVCVHELSIPCGEYGLPLVGKATVATSTTSIQTKQLTLPISIYMLLLLLILYSAILCF